MSEELRVPDAIEPIVAWRYWRGGGDGRLRSLTGTQPVWEPGQAFAARCRFREADPMDWRYRLVAGYTAAPHSVPGEGCTCGVYAAKDLGHLRGQPLFGLPRMVVGQARLWGKVIPGQFGYRAEYAYPERLCVFERVAERNPDLLDALGRYGVPVEVVARRAVGYSPALAVAQALKSRRP